MEQFVVVVAEWDQIEGYRLNSFQTRFIYVVSILSANPMSITVDSTLFSKLALFTSLSTTHPSSNPRHAGSWGLANLQSTL
jgi:hypothetical protein